MDLPLGNTIRSPIVSSKTSDKVSCPRAVGKRTTEISCKRWVVRSRDFSVHGKCWFRTNLEYTPKGPGQNCPCFVTITFNFTRNIWRLVGSCLFSRTYFPNGYFIFLFSFRFRFSRVPFHADLGAFCSHSLHLNIETNKQNRSRRVSV